MGLRELAEGIILQSIEDLWSEDLAGECMEFFRGRDFRICAELAKMNLIDQVKLLNLVKEGIECRRKASVREGGLIQKGKTLPRIFNSASLSP